MRNFLIVFAVLLVVAVGASAFVASKKDLDEQTPLACSLEAKVCPDGSAVSRTGPSCEFAKCPQVKEQEEIEKTEVSKAKGTLEGVMTIGPVCPVERIDTPCEPTPEMFAARKIAVYTSDRKSLVTTVTPNGTGIFSVSLESGNYYVDLASSQSGIGGASGLPTLITIKSGAAVQLTIDVDTGIR